MSGARLLAAFSAAVVLVLLAGCGGSSSHHDSAGGLRYRTYAGSGFTVSTPAGWRQVGGASAAGGAASVVLTAPDHSALLTIHVYPNSSQGVDQTIASTLGADQLEANQGAIRDLHWHIRTAAVKGASGAKVLTESYTNTGGRQRYTGLVVLSASGTLIDVETIASPGAPASYPNPVIDSFRLAQGGVTSAA